MKRSNKLLISLTVLALSSIAVAACDHGGTSSRPPRIEVTPEFLDQLESELPAIEACCEAGITVIDDWIVQNEPKGDYQPTFNFEAF